MHLFARFIFNNFVGSLIMSFRSMLGVSVVVICSFRIANGEVILIHDSTIQGNGSMPTDGFNLTRDTATGLDWLDLTLSQGRSHAEIIGEFEAGGRYEGFRYANSSELGTLFYSSLDLTGFETPAERDLLEAISMFGMTAAGGSFSEAMGSFYSDDLISTRGEARLFHRFDFTTATIEPLTSGEGPTAGGHWLVRPIPVPEPHSVFPVVLFGGLTVLLSQRREFDWQR